MTTALIALALLQSKPGISPVRVQNNHGFVTVKIGNSRPLTMLLDTGAASTVVSDHTAKELGLPEKQRFQLTTAADGRPVYGVTTVMNGLEFAGVKFDRVPAMSFDLPNLERASCLRFDGVLGMDFLAPYVLVLDYAKGKAEITPTEAFSYNGSGYRMPFRYDRGYIEFRAKVAMVGGVAVDTTFALDSGAGIATGIILSTPFAAENGFPGAAAPRVKEPFVKQAVWGDTVMTMAGLGSLSIGPFSFAKPAAFISADKVAFFAQPGRAGLVGTAYIRKFRLYIDFPRKELIFEPNGDVRKPVDVVYTGLTIRGSEKDYSIPEVESVQSASPAAFSGFRAGDRLLDLDGAKAVGPSVLMTLSTPGKPVRVKVLRGNKEVTLTLTRNPPW
jgi:predicted aspartyl protease